MAFLSVAFFLVLSAPWFLSRSSPLALSSSLSLSSRALGLGSAATGAASPGPRPRPSSPRGALGFAGSGEELATGGRSREELPGGGGGDGRGGTPPGDPVPEELLPGDSAGRRLGTLDCSS